MAGGNNNYLYVPNPTGWVDPFGLVAKDCMVSPKDVKFSQPIANQDFSSKGTINDLVEDLKSGDIKVDDIPAIRVVEKNGELITLDNRRLVAFNQAGIEKIPIERVSLSDPAIAKEFAKKYNPINGGQNIVITPNAAARKPTEVLLREFGKIN